VAESNFDAAKIWMSEQQKRIALVKVQFLLFTTVADTQTLFSLLFSLSFDSFIFLFVSLYHMTTKKSQSLVQSFVMTSSLSYILFLLLIFI
jgi:hypothetical protein